MKWPFLCLHEGRSAIIGISRQLSQVHWSPVILSVEYTWPSLIVSYFSCKATDSFCTRNYGAMDYVHNFCIDSGNLMGPFFKDNTKTIERLQKRATKSVPNLKKLQYEDRLREFNLPSLQHRRHRGDMIYTYKVITEKVKIKPNETTNRTLRGHYCKIQKRRQRNYPPSTFLAIASSTTGTSYQARSCRRLQLTLSKTTYLDAHWKDETFLPSL